MLTRNTGEDEKNQKSYIVIKSIAHEISGISACKI